MTNAGFTGAMQTGERRLLSGFVRISYYRAERSLT
jgi:hypothetical protein